MSIIKMRMGECRENIECQSEDITELYFLTGAIKMA